MRMFLIVVISTIFYPSIENFVNLNYLPYLLDISQIQTYDWCSHALNYILSEVKKYQTFISSKDDGSIYVGSCLPILAVSFFLFLYDIFHWLPLLYILFFSYNHYFFFVDSLHWLPWHGSQLSKISSDFLWRAKNL